jgi:hypothetical protein
MCVNTDLVLRNPALSEPFFEAQDSGAHGDYGKDEQRINIDRHLCYLSCPFRKYASSDILDCYTFQSPDNALCW